LNNFRLLPLLFLLATDARAEEFWVPNHDIRVAIPLQPFTAAIQQFTNTTYGGKLNSPPCGVNIDLTAAQVAPIGILDFRSGAPAFALKMGVNFNAHFYNWCNVVNPTVTCSANAHIGELSIDSIGGGNCQVSVAGSQMNFDFPLQLPAPLSGLDSYPVVLSKGDASADSYLFSEFGELKDDGTWIPASDPTHRSIAFRARAMASSAAPTTQPVSSSDLVQLVMSPDYLVVDASAGTASFYRANSLTDAISYISSNLPALGSEPKARLEISTSVFGIGGSTLTGNGIFGSVLPIKVQGRRKLAQNLYAHFNFVISGARVGIGTSGTAQVIAVQLTISKIQASISTNRDEVGTPATARPAANLQVVLTVPELDNTTGIVVTRLTNLSLGIEINHHDFSGEVTIPNVGDIFVTKLFNLGKLNTDLPIQLPDCVPLSVDASPDRPCSTAPNSSGALSNDNPSLASTIRLDLLHLSPPVVNASLGTITYDIPVIRVARDAPPTTCPFAAPDTTNVRYSVVDVGSLNPNLQMVGVRAINGGGAVVGMSSVRWKPPTSHAFLFRDGSIRDLNATADSQGVATGINASGVIVGTVLNTPPSHPFIYQNGVMKDLPLAIGTSTPRAINDAGIVVGDSHGHAFIYSNGNTADLGTLGGPTSTALGVNNAGQVIGTSDLVTGGTTHAFIYDSGHMIDIGTLGGATSGGAAINNTGDATGKAQVTGQTAHPFLYHQGVMHDLLPTDSPLAGEGDGINDAGQIVGYLQMPYPSPCGGLGGDGVYLYQNGTMWSLDTLIDQQSSFYGHVVLGKPFGINNNGQIVALGTDRRDISKMFIHGFILTPLPAQR
jgi:probable HAF family extracellular repeat protein